MKLLSRSLAQLALLTLPAMAVGQDASTQRDRWSLGAGAAVIASPYAGEGSRVRPFPLIGYEGDRVFLRGTSGGVHLYQSRQWTLDAVLSARLHGFDVSDLGSAELRANGVNPSLLSDRDDGLDAGLRATYRTPYGTLAFEALRDITGTSDGTELSFDYRYSWRVERTAITASAGASWMSSRLSGYYFGILDEEVARGVAAYSPGSALVPRIGLSLAHPIGATRWHLFGSFEYQFLPSELRHSPLMDSDRRGVARAVLGLSRSF